MTDESRFSKKGNTLSTAGKLAIDSPVPHASRILQVVDNDEDFQPIPNVATTYQDLEGNPTEQSEMSPGNTLPVSTAYRPSPTRSSLDPEYQKIVTKLKTSSKAAADSIARRKKERHRAFMEEDDGLSKIEDIIGEIQGVMQGIEHTAAHGSTIKGQSKLTNPQKRKWHNKGVSKFPTTSEAPGISKLE